MPPLRASHQRAASRSTPPATAPTAILRTFTSLTSQGPGSHASSFANTGFICSLLSARADTAERPWVGATKPCKLAVPANGLDRDAAVVVVQPGASRMAIAPMSSRATVPKTVGLRPHVAWLGRWEAGLGGGG